MSDLMEFLHMGGYALYVWGSYALTLIVLMINYIQPLMRERRLINRLAKQRTSPSPKS